MARTGFSVGPEVLLERYGVSATRVFGSTQPGGASSLVAASPRRDLSASLGARARVGDALPLVLQHKLPGSLAGSISAGSVMELDNLSALDNRSARSQETFAHVPTLGDALVGREHAYGDASSCTSAPLASASVGASEADTLSLGELRDIVLPLATRSPQGRSAFRTTFPHSFSRTGLSQSLPNRSFQSASSSSRGPRFQLSAIAPASPPAALSASATAAAAALRSAAVRRAAALDERQAVERRRSKGQSAQRAAAASEKEVANVADSADVDDAESMTSDAKELDAGAASSIINPLPSLGIARGQARRKKGKAKPPDNPFVEYEDREQRLMWERRWLKDDDVYMRERMKGMHLDSVQSRMNKGAVDKKVMYENSVYFGAYSCELKTLLKKKAESRKVLESSVASMASVSSMTSLPSVREPRSRGSDGVSAAIESKEAEHHAKHKKGQGEKSHWTKSVISLRSMQDVLEESVRKIKQED